MSARLSQEALQRANISKHKPNTSQRTQRKGQSKKIFRKMFLVWGRSGNSKFHICLEPQKLINGPNTDNHSLMSFSPSTLVSLMTKYCDLMLVAQRLGSYMMTCLQTGLMVLGSSDCEQLCLAGSKMPKFVKKSYAILKQVPKLLYTSPKMR